jgi:ABC-type Fe3+-siderophore transport system permease subunit
MTITNPIGTTRTSIARPTTGPTIALTSALAGTLAVAAVLQPQVAPEALVPMAASLIFLFAAVTALVAWLRPMSRRQFTYWDAAGLLTFIGICVSASVEPEQMVQLVAGAESPR